MTLRALRGSAGRLRALGALVLCLGPAGPLNAQAPPAHTLDLYAYERPGNPILGSHSFAVLDGRYCLSWNPATTRVGLVVPTRGRNFSYAETLQAAQSVGATAYYVGRVALTEAQYRRAVALLFGMSTGEFPYRLPGGRLAGDGYNCVTVLAAIGNGPFRSGLAHGVGASRLVLEHLRKGG